MTPPEVPAAALVAPQRVVVICSYTRSLKVFRFDLLQRMVSLGHEVVAFGPEEDGQTISELRRIGVRFERTPMARASIAPLHDVWTLFLFWRKLRRIKPDVLLPYTMKPIIYGLIAGRGAGVPRRFALVTGLGWTFGDHGASTMRRLVRGISLQLYRSALTGVKTVFVYNEADEDDMVRERLLPPGAALVRVPGSGVNLADFPQVPVPPGPPVFLMIGRLLREKGVLDYVEAARILKRRFPSLVFRLVGPLDPNPTGLTSDMIQDWVREGVIEYLGETRDVRPFLAQCGVFVLPSYYREGIPRTILEALATGRAVVTSDRPGCAETVQPGVSGWVVPPRDPEALAEALARFQADPGLAAKMGAASRALAERQFSVDLVNRQLLAELGLEP